MAMAGLLVVLSMRCQSLEIVQEIVQYSSGPIGVHSASGYA